MHLNYADVAIHDTFPKLLRIQLFQYKVRDFRLRCCVQLKMEQKNNEKLRISENLRRLEIDKNTQISPNKHKLTKLSRVARWG